MISSFIDSILLWKKVSSAMVVAGAGGGDVGELAGGDPDTMVGMRRQAAGALGVISAVGAFGGFVVPLAYAWSKSEFGGIEPALRFYVVFFLGLLGVTWYCYLRKHNAITRVGI